ncbi:MAG: LamG domain-containing protein [Chitinispirillaceae bacterium]|nr:LamG domain-containing protein [Chitinispirillaceae bacterium]
MNNAVLVLRRLLVPLLFFCSCFGPFDPYNPAPDKPGDNDTPIIPTTTQHPKGLAGWWTCDDTAGTTLTDSLGKSNGQIIGCTRDSGKSGLALGFDGSGNYVSIAPTTDSLFEFGAGDFTISVWVKPRITEAQTDTTRYDIIAKGVARQSGYSLSILNNRFSAFVGQYSTGSIDTEFPANANIWRHCVMLRRKGTVELYVNGNRTQTYQSSSNVSSGLYLLFGKDASTRRDTNYPGLIDEIKILNTAWSEADVNNEYRRFVD